MIKKLEEHRDTIQLVVQIGAIHGIPVVPTTNNDERGDFSYPKERKEDLLRALDDYIGKYRHKGD